jgi:3-deoxy-D-manno-octulosonate 8-phosphate phosphatase (KDO 8-P phosphatase)
MDQEILERAKKIKLLLLDCDGVLTDGRIYLTAAGEEIKTFDVKDGQGIALLHKAGVESGIISGRISMAAEHRASELGMKFVYQGVADKAACLTEILSKSGCVAAEVCFVGDDIGDLPVMDMAGLAVAVSDAVKPVKKAAHLVTKKKGGRGAVREVCDLLFDCRQD